MKSGTRWKLRLPLLNNRRSMFVSLFILGFVSILLLILNMLSMDVSHSREAIIFSAPTLIDQYKNWNPVKISGKDHTIRSPQGINWGDDGNFYCPFRCDEIIPPPLIIDKKDPLYIKGYTDFRNWNEERIYQFAKYLCQRRKYNLERNYGHQDVEEVTIFFNSETLHKGYRMPQGFAQLGFSAEHHCAVPCKLTDDFETASIILGAIGQPYFLELLSNVTTQSTALYWPETLLSWVYNDTWKGPNQEFEVSKTFEEFDQLHHIDYLLSFEVFSDVPWGYVTHIESTDWIVKHPNTTITKRKDFLIVTYVSHCAYERMVYIKELENYVGILNVGKCTEFKHHNASIATGLRAGLWEQKDEFTRHFYFILTFENSQRYNYVSEKLFHGLILDAVPIYFGAPNVDSTLDPGFAYFDRVFIDAYEYPNPKDLADYLHYLVENPEEYEKYFLWKKSFKTIGHDRSLRYMDVFKKDVENNLLCRLCTHYYYGRDVCNDTEIF